MATVNFTRGSATEGTHVSGLSNRVPYMVERIVDFAEVTTTKGSALATGDIIQVINVPANTLLHGAIAEVLTVDTSTGATFDLDVAAGDDFIDGGDLNTLGYPAVGSNGLAPFGANTVLPTSAADTIDMLLNVPGATVPANGKVRVVAWMTDASELGLGGVATRDYLA